MKVYKILILLMIAAGSAFAGVNSLSLSNGSGTPGSVGNLVYLNLANEDTIRGIQFRLIDNSDYLTVDSIWTENIQRSQLFSYNYYPELNTSEILLLQSKTRTIEPQTANILYIAYSVSEDAPAGQEYELTFEEVTVSDVDNEKLPYTLSNSSFLIKTIDTGINDGSKTITQFELAQNYPNPFNPNTRIQYSIAAAEHVKLEIFNALGQKVRSLVDQPMQAGKFSVMWNGMNDKGFQVPSGVYFYSIHAGDFKDTKSLTLMK